MPEKSKAVLRREMKARAGELPAAYYEEASGKIREKLLQLPAWRDAGTIMAYVSMPTEPETRELIRQAGAEGKKVLLPRCADRTRMEAVPFTGWEAMKQNAYGIPEPTGEADPEPPELILVPCVAATPKGIRLGHGAGYYDRFLREQAGTRICLCFQAFLREELPAGPWDVPMDLVLTEGEAGKMKTYSFYGWEGAEIREAHGLTPRDLYDLLRGIWCAETCAPRMREDWSPQNPTWGQCSITAFLVQDLFGGKVYGVPLEDGSVHCFNAVGDCVFDLTSEQFGKTRLNYEKCPEQFRENHFAKAEKKERYETLKAGLMEKIGAMQS